MQSKGIGLVLAGGGGKGAYHIGVWKALNEYNITKQITAVSGTSVGALNAVLFAQGDYSKAESLWSNIRQSQILSDHSSEKITKFLALMNDKNVANSWFSRDGLKELIANNISWGNIGTGALPCYAACLKIMDKSLLEWLFHFNETIFSRTPLGNIISGAVKLALGKIADDNIEYFKLSDYSDKDKQAILLATSAIPIVFPDEKINDAYYIDGGVKDNIPIRPLYDSGYREIIVVHCGGDSLIDQASFPGCRIINIYPQQYQGDFLSGTLDFEAVHAKMRMTQGYEDAKKVLGAIIEMEQIQWGLLGLMYKAKADEERFHRDMNVLQKERDDLKNEMNDLLGE